MTNDQENGLDLEALISQAGELPAIRLEGDDLYLWAKLIAEMEHLQERVNSVGTKLIAKYGRDHRFVLTDQGYILPADQMRRTMPESGRDYPN